MARKQKQKQHNRPRKPSKRQRMRKFIIYIMVAGMLLSAFTYGLAFIL